MVKLNLLVRLKNKAFVISMFTTIVAFIYQMLALFNIVTPISQEQTTQVFMIVVNLLAGLGVLVDPTTKGLSDSERVLNRRD
nr:MAG TPA: holin [Caudoviricetes sp.]